MEKFRRYTSSELLNAMQVALKCATTVQTYCFSKKFVLPMRSDESNKQPLHYKPLIVYLQMTIYCSCSPLRTSAPSSNYPQQYPPSSFQNYGSQKVPSTCQELLLPIWKLLAFEYHPLNGMDQFFCNIKCKRKFYYERIFPTNEEQVQVLRQILDISNSNSHLY